jgi:hypothetical protein
VDQAVAFEHRNVAGLASAVGQLAHGLAADVEEIHAAGVALADPEGFDADTPSLVGFVEMHQAVGSQRFQNAVRGAWSNTANRRSPK